MQTSNRRSVYSFCSLSYLTKALQTKLKEEAREEKKKLQQMEEQFQVKNQLFVSVLQQDFFKR